MFDYQVLTWPYWSYWLLLGNGLKHLWVSCIFFLILPVESGRLLEFIILSKFPQRTGHAPLKRIKPCDRTPTSVWDGRAFGHYFSVRGRRLCRLVHMFIVDLQLAEATQNRQVSGKLEGNRSDINYRFGYGSDLTNWEAMNNATGCYRGNATTWHCNHLLLNQLIPKDLQSFHALNRSQMAGHSQRSWIPRLARNQQQWNPIKAICHIPLPSGNLT